MKRTFKEKAVFLSARVIKKNKIFTPIVYPVLGVVLLINSFGKFLYANGKKYIAICVVLLFFFMSTSFTRPEDGVENETYLSANGEINIYDNEVSLHSSDIMVVSGEELDSASYAEMEDLLSEEEKLELNTLSKEDTFTISDFYEGLTLNDTKPYESLLGSFDKDAWNLILVNKTNPLPTGYEVKLATIRGSMQCDERVLEPLYDMLNAASKDGNELIVCSPYREDKLQEKLFLRKINAYMNRGYSYLDAYKISSQDVIVPGTSEHQLGLAFDIVVGYHSVLDFEFGDTKAGIWLNDHCCEYGFILRYPRGKEDITGIEYEPWHFRYVGVEAATYIMENGLTLEEFVESLE